MTRGKGSKKLKPLTPKIDLLSLNVLKGYCQGDIARIRFLFGTDDLIVLSSIHQESLPTVRHFLTSDIGGRESTEDLKRGRGSKNHKFWREILFVAPLTN